MSDLSSGAYVIDDDCTVVSYNRTIKDLYPQIQLGEKCHKCLMGLDEPCPPCPVANHNYGPRAYLDPIRDIYETANALNQFGSDYDVSFYRFGGDEIVGLAHDDVSRVPQLASSLLAVVRDLRVGLETGKTLHLTASIGYTTVLHGYQEAIDAADRAMYAAKRRGKNQVACIDE